MAPYHGISDFYVMPWFSWQEWLEVYEKTFSKDSESWMFAFKQITSWKARRSNLPLGVEATLPLLEGCCASRNETLDASTKFTLMSMAVQRFVNILMKSVQVKYKNMVRMVDMAAEIGLPEQFVDLRNELIHCISPAVSEAALVNAIFDGLLWIKGYYWDVEKCNVDNESTLNDMTLDCSIQQLSEVATYLQNVVIEGKEDQIKDAADPVIASVMLHSCKDLQKCIQVIYTSLFLPNDGYSHSVKSSVADFCKECGSSISRLFIAAVDNVLMSIHCVGGLALLMECFINDHRKHAFFVDEWLRIFSMNLLESEERKGEKKKLFCVDHRLGFYGDVKKVDWDYVLQKLLEVNEVWSRKYFKKIVRSPVLNIVSDKQKRYIELVKIFHLSAKYMGKNEEMQLTTDDAKFHELDSILKEECLEADEIDKALAYKMQIMEEDREFSPLGVLPHQMGNNYLYRDLILDIPD